MGLSRDRAKVCYLFDINWRPNIVMQPRAGTTSAIEFGAVFIADLVLLHVISDLVVPNSLSVQICPSSF